MVGAILGTAALAQDKPPTDPNAGTPQTAPAAVPAPAPSPWTKKGVDFYLLGDVYGDINFNHPAAGFNQLYNFDDRANAAHLNFAKFAMEKASGVFGFRLDAGTGRTVDVISATDPAPKGFKYLEQMFLEFRPNHAHGLQIDAGKFVTPDGAEVIETNNNWNYSRSLLFVWAIPYYHFGVRATIPVTKTFTAGIHVVNGWNNLWDNNTGKTIGLMGNFTWKKAAWSNSFHTGPEHDHTNKGIRQLYDTVLTLTPNDKTSVYFNFDYGADNPVAGARQKWMGFAGAFRYQLTKRFAIAPRAEVFSDMDGFTTGVAQTVKEFTLTAEMKIRDGLLSRLEFRRDMSDKPYFDRGLGIRVANNQTTLALGFIAFFGPKKT
jgi:Putative beta-barrel porin-2, OmpL-like. bbp2